MEYVGPTHNITIHTHDSAFDELSFVQELLLNLSELKYLKLGYTPFQGWSLQLFVNGLMMVRDIDYHANGRLIEFVNPLMAGNDKITACYVTTGIVTPPEEPTIEFDVQSMNVRVTQAGTLQVLMPDGEWHNMIPAVNPVTGAFIFEPDQDPA